MNGGFWLIISKGGLGKRGKCCRPSTSEGVCRQRGLLRVEAGMEGGDILFRQVDPQEE